MSWRFAFSTLGVPGAPLAEVTALAQGAGCDGLELRVHPDEFLHLEVSDAEAAETGRRVREAGLEISGLAGYAKVCGPQPDDEVVEEMRELLRLASQTGAQAVRLFPGGEAEAESTEHRERALHRIGTVLPEAKEAGVQLLVETHDSHPTGAQSLELVAELGEPEWAAVLWDGLHPWRSGESPSETKATLGDHLAYFQVKDAVRWMNDDGTLRWIPVLCGAGEVPLEEQGALLQDFSGWISLEWEKAWHPQIEPLEEALPSAAAWFRRWAPARGRPRVGAEEDAGDAGDVGDAGSGEPG